MPTLDYLVEHTNLTLPQIAAASGLDVKRVEAIIDGRWTPSPSERAAIAAVFGLPVDQIAFGHNMNARNIRFHRFGLKENFDGDRE